jgi:uncharacterized membrane protein
MKQQHKKIDSKRKIVRIGTSLKEIVTVRDEKGDILHRIINPLMIEFRSHDVIQVIVGSLLLAVPVGFTEEVWRLGYGLPVTNIMAFFILSITFIAIFVYYNSYKHHFQSHKSEYYKRVFSIYVISFVVVGIFLTMVQQAPWTTDFVLAIKRTILVAFPASMSAAVADMIK